MGKFFLKGKFLLDSKDLVFVSRNHIKSTILLGKKFKRGDMRKVCVENMGGADYGWLKTKYHFSFANYYNPDNVNFGVLRVLNDDYIAPGTGFDKHGHKDMEILTYVITGFLTHQDSMGNKGKIGRGEMQYMSAGRGIFHSEYNHESIPLRLLQIWILPDRISCEPNYGEWKFPWEDREGRWLHMVTGRESTMGGLLGEERSAPIEIHQDINIYSLFLEKGQKRDLRLCLDRMAYLVQIEGKSVIEGVEGRVELHSRDALEVVCEDINLQAESKSHFLCIEMPADS